MYNSGQATHYPCSVCGAVAATVFVTIPQAPVLCNILWPTKAEATSVARVDIPLAFCSHCGHIFNPCFDPALMNYSQVYENSLHYSPHFQKFAEALAQELIDRHDLHNKRLIEISCGKGDFLELICQLGPNRGVGFDPSYIPRPSEQNATPNLEFVQDFYSEQYAHYAADFIYCRHTLEHIQHPTEFLAMVRRTIGERPMAVYFEVPNVLFTLQDLAVWDIIYEHCNYFSKQSISFLFAQRGFQVDNVQTTYGGQFLYIEATQNNLGQSTLGAGAELAADVASFAERYRAKVAAESKVLADLAQAGKKAVIWGAGSKGITFLNTMQSAGQIDYAVDLNPRKQGMYITGTGQQIVAPDFLRNYQPDVIFVMNAIYLAEIQQMAANMGLACEFICV